MCKLITSRELLVALSDTGVVVVVVVVVGADTVIVVVEREDEHVENKDNVGDVEV